VLEEQVDLGDPPTTLSAVDPDADALVYTLVDGDLPAGLTLNADGTWSGDVGAAGTFVVTVESCDPLGECAQELLTIAVTQAALITLTQAALPPTDTSGPIASEGVFVDLRITAGLVLVMLGTAAGSRQRRPRAIPVGYDSSESQDDGS
jgi:hypothetical protein